ncbi:MAG: phosphate ABC transporter substrate-binding protein, partial [Nitrosomonadales bacterium]|nr:phosphate ABC transporter substrate-binding protein [Nitrosomonadales bacterium]
MNSTMLKYFSVTVLAVCASHYAIAGDVVVIANPGTTISAAEIKDVFLGEKQFAGSTKLIVIDNKSLQQDFLAKFMKMDTPKYNGIWTKKSFRD